MRTQSIATKYATRVTTQPGVDAFIRARLQELADDSIACDDAGRLTQKTRDILADSGIMRVFQPLEYSGMEGNPVDFAALIIDLCAEAPSAGWVCGVVGVHAFEFAQGHPKLQDEIWAPNHDIWTASPYAMIGRARRVEGGWQFSGRWPFSSGTDWCEWIVVGGMAEAADGSNPGVFNVPHHFVLPRKDYIIHDDSWDTMGLRGTGSKDVEVIDAFVPDYRVFNADKLNARGYHRENRPQSRVYELPFDFFFPGIISAATIGLATGVVRRFREYSESRVTRSGVKAIDNPFQMAALAAAEADIEASRLHLLHDLKTAYDVAMSGGIVEQTFKHAARRNQVRAVRRAADAAQQVFGNVGGNVARNSNSIQRFYRDMTVALCHACNVDQPVYAAQAANTFGKPIPPGIIV